MSLPALTLPTDRDNLGASRCCVDLVFCSNLNKGQNTVAAAKVAFPRHPIGW